MAQVWWALCSRMDPVVDIEVVKRCWSTSLDPMSYPPEKPVFNNRMVIDACRPWERLATFPKVTEAGPELKRKVLEKWRSVLPDIADQHSRIAWCTRRSCRGRPPSRCLACFL